MFFRPPIRPDVINLERRALALPLRLLKPEYEVRISNILFLNKHKRDDGRIGDGSLD